MSAGRLRRVAAAGPPGIEVCQWVVVCHVPAPRSDGQVPVRVSRGRLEWRGELRPSATDGYRGPGPDLIPGLHGRQETPSDEAGIFHLHEQAMNKLPKITLAFWLMKIAATTLGETAGDMLSMTLGVGYVASSVILFVGFLGSVALQLRSRRYRPALYWLVIVSTSTAGTTISDMMDRTFELGYPAGSAILLTILGAIFAYWYSSGESLAVDQAQSPKVELLYWTTILFSNTLGTALGDFLADSSGLGFAGGAALVGSLIAGVIVLHFTTRISKVALFWIAFVLTRPFGAQFGDVLTKPHEKGGLDLGTMGSSAVLLAILVVLVGRETLAQRRLASSPAGAA